MDKLDIKKFDPEFLTNIRKLADALEVEPEVFIENIIIKRLADDQAEIDVNKTGKVIMPEFMTFDGEVKRGHELYKILYNLEREQLERKEVVRIENKLQYIDYEKLTEQEKELMKRRGLDPETKKQKEENKKEIQDMIDRGEIGEVVTEWTGEKK